MKHDNDMTIIIAQFNLCHNFPKPGNLLSQNYFLTGFIRKGYKT